MRTVTREEAERDNHTTPNALMFIFTPKGAVWVQKRAKTKKHFPGLWDISACGGIVHGEKPEVSAQREMEEEMGFTCPLHFVEFFFNEFPGEHGSMHRRISHLYIGMSDKIPQVNEEVDEFVSVPAAELAQKIQQHPEEYVPSFLMELEKARAAYAKLF
ncbi:MAG: NUDIX domain-containing protein [Patescibacteria group bacterium]